MFGSLQLEVGKRIVICNEKCFLEELQNKTTGGKQIVPLVGAGISVASGIPTIPEIESYLEDCIKLAVRTSKDPYHWTPEIGWPDLQFFRHQTTLPPKIERIDKFSISAAGAVADWRNSLDFLSRLDLNQARRIGPPNNGILDSFFGHLTQGKIPNLCHRMIANLAANGRVELILTTNFDELIEAAIEEQLSLRLTTIALHHSTQLPPFSTFDGKESKLTLLKLHGGRYGLRADDSIDVPASELEKLRFKQYFHPPEAQRSTSSLLVAGLSFGEKRLESLIKELRYEGGPNIFLCCYSRSDVFKAVSFCNRLDSEGPNEKSDKLPRIYIHQSRDVGLMLLRFYQILTNSLPPKGIVTSNQVNVPWPAMADYLDITSPNQTESKESIFDLANCGENNKCPSEIQNFLYGEPFIQCRRLINSELDSFAVKSAPTTYFVFGSKQYQGLTDLMGCVFYDRIEAGENCIWFDLDTAGSVDDFYEKLVECIVARNASRSWTPQGIRKNNDKRIAALVNHLRQSPQRWLFMINAREGAGTNGPWNSKWSQKKMKGKIPPENGWLDHKLKSKKKRTSVEEFDQRYDSDSDNLENFLNLVTQISRQNGVQATFVVIAHQFRKQNDKDAPLYTHVTERLADKYTEVEDIGYQNYSPAIKIKRKDIKSTSPKANSSTHLQNVRAVILHPEFQRQNQTAGKSFRQKKSIRDVALSWLKIDDIKSPKKRVAIREWESYSRYSFLLSMVLMRKPRSIVAAWGYAFRPSEKQDLVFSAQKDSSKFRDPSNYLDSLLELGLVCTKPGGFLWVNSHARDEILRLLIPSSRTSRPEIALKAISNRILRKRWLKHWTSPEVAKVFAAKWLVGKANLGIASMYRRELQSSGEAICAIDAVRHYIESFKAFLEIYIDIRKPKKPNNKKSDEKRNYWKSAADDTFEKAMLSISYANQLVSEYKTSIVDQGVANCKCRRFEAILNVIDDLVGGMIKKNLQSFEGKDHAGKLGDTLKAIAKLRISIFEVVSKVALETGFVRRAYIRQRQVAGWNSILNEIQEKFLQNEEPELIVGESREFLDQFIARSKAFRSIRYKKNAKHPELQEYESNQKSRNANDSISWLRYKRSILELHIASRSYYRGQDALIKIFSWFLNEQENDEWRLLKERPDGEKPSADSTSKYSYGFEFVFGISQLKESLKKSSQLLNEIAQKGIVEKGIALGLSGRTELVKSGTRQMQLCSLIIQLVDFIDELPGDELPALRDIRKEAVATSIKSFDTTTSIINGLGKAEGSGSLLKEMQKLETHTAVLKRFEVIKCKNDEKNESIIDEYLWQSLRSLDHAESWQDRNRDNVSSAIILLERAALHLDYAETRRLDDRHLTFSSELRQDLALRDHKDADKKDWSRVNINDYINKTLDDTTKPEKKGLSSVSDVGLQVRIGERLIANARNLIEFNKQCIWWLSFADQLSLQSHRTRLAVAVRNKKVPGTISVPVNQKWQLEFERVMEQVDRILNLDSIRYARCLHLFCDCAYFILLLRPFDGDDPAYNEKIARLRFLISKYKERLHGMMREKKEFENNHKTIYGNELCETYTIGIENYCERTIQELSLASA